MSAQLLVLLAAQSNLPQYKQGKENEGNLIKQGEGVTSPLRSVGIFTHCRTLSIPLATRSYDPNHAHRTEILFMITDEIRGAEDRREDKGEARQEAYKISVHTSRAARTITTTRAYEWSNR